MTPFTDIREALAFTVEHPVGKGHAFIVNIRGRREAAKNYGCTMQVVDQDMAFSNGTHGLAVYLPFDTTVRGTSAALKRFQAMPESSLFSDVTYTDGIECYAVAFGKDVSAATALVYRVLEKIYRYSPGDAFECEVHDEG